MSAFWIAHVQVHDAEAYGRYAALATGVVAAHGGVFLARGGRARVMEGPERPRHVVVRFPTFEAAVACYESPGYQAALAHARGAAERELVIVEASDG
ncbi:MAG: DUF1330 domain-containing protein [Rhodobacteraceae bacterium]|nr:DUF1330 domain-containing protein [Paracoccaceae bacterium]